MDEAAAAGGMRREGNIERPRSNVEWRALGVWQKGDGIYRSQGILP